MTRLTWSLFLCVAFGLQLSSAQNTPAGETLSGSTQKSEDLIVKVDVIFVGEITEMGFPVPTATGVTTYSGVKVNVLQVLKGSVNLQEIKVTLRPKWSENVHEMPPTVGSSYIFFVRKEDDRFGVLKLFPATDANIAKVKALIAAAPK